MRRGGHRSTDPLNDSINNNIIDSPQMDPCTLVCIVDEKLINSFLSCLHKKPGHVKILLYFAIHI